MTAPRACCLCLAALLVGPSRGVADGQPQREFGGATPLQWSVRMADSEMARRGDSLAWKEGGKAKWDYTVGLFTLSLLKLNERVPDPRYVAFAETAIGSFISTNGDIQGYKAAEYNIDNINPGKTVLALYLLTKDERYKKAADLLRKQLDTHPRTNEGGFWHKRRYPQQMWLDGLYMGAPFYAQYTQLFNGPAADFDDVAKQLRLINEHLYDPTSGLFYHGWDESKQQDWANKTNGTSANFWGRGLGWYAMALVDVLDFLPKDHPARPEIVAIFKKVSDGIVKHQDPASGLWWQVLDQGGRKGNYLEATASSMFVYAIAKGVNRGYLSRDYVPAILKGYSGITGKLIKTDGDKISLTQCCSVAGLGYGRDGSYEYYLKEPIVENDLKGVGPFILAGIELQQLLGSPGNDLSSWVPVNEVVFTVTNGVVRIEKGMGWLRTEKEYMDFILEAEWRGMETNYNSGFFIRAGLDGKPFPTGGWQVNLKDSAIGALLKGRDVVVPSKTPKITVGEWVKFRMEVRGKTLALFVNGESAWEFDQLDAVRGYIGIQAEGKAMEFRNVRVRELVGPPGLEPGTKGL